MTTTAFITGGASGIGLALARKLGEQGARVIIVDCNEEVLQASHRALQQEGIPIESALVDVTDRDAICASVEAFAHKHGRLDYIFNNAGVGIAGEVRDMTHADWRRVIDINLYGVIHGIEAAYPIMLRQQHGHIVNTSSVAGLVPLPGEAAYVASKYAVVGLSHTLRAEAAALGVKVSVVCPGVVRTPIYDTSPVVGFHKDKAMSLWPKGITAESCADQIVDGIARNRATIVVTPLAQFLWRFHRTSPSAYLHAAARYMQQLRHAREV